MAAGLLVVMSLSAFGCQQWRLVSGPVPEAASQAPRKRVRVTTRSGIKVEADSLTVVGGDLTLWNAFQVPNRHQREPAMQLPVEEVIAVETRGPSPGATVLTAVAVVAAVAVFVWLVTTNAGGSLGGPYI